MSVEDAWYRLDRETGRKVPTQRHGRGKRWRVRNRGARTESFERKADAVARDNTVNADLMRGVTPFDHRAGTVTFKTYAEQWLREHHYDPSSRKQCRTKLNVHLLPTFGHKRMKDIRPSLVKSWLAEMRDKKSPRTGEPLAPATITSVYTMFVSIVRAAMVDGVIASNPCQGVERPRPVSRQVMGVWEPDTVAAILGAVPDRHHALVALAAQCGLRQGEAFAVAQGDISFLRRELTVRHQVKRVDGKITLTPPKRGKVRTVPLPDVTKEALSEHIRRYGTAPARCRCCKTTHDVLFVDEQGRLLDKRAWYRHVWYGVLAAAGMTPDRDKGLHQLRHAYVSALIDGGADMKMVQKYVGHESIKITADVYGHLFERSHDRARSIIDAAFAPADAGVYPVRTGEQR